MDPLQSAPSMIGKSQAVNQCLLILDLVLGGTLWTNVPALGSFAKISGAWFVCCSPAFLRLLWFCIPYCNPLSLQFEGNAVFDDPCKMGGKSDQKSPVYNRVRSWGGPRLSTLVSAFWFWETFVGFFPLIVCFHWTSSPVLQIAWNNGQHCRKLED